MKKQVFENFDITLLPSLGMILFLVLFIGVVIWVFRKSSEKLYHEVENLPLEEAKHE